ncbi:hypothetical protein PCA20602_01478 [Pandoraea capi]|uniref:Uncharacterized protein n=1 Tax=Pandoraea capi TaxID=2508286 RepID=A0ABY6VTV8_9BURK|nr:hypothetical protein PCA20602_01478 [Pandoraea capi]
MNWRRAYSTIQIWFVVCLASAFGAGFWSFLIAGICRVAFGLEERVAMTLIFLPFAVVFFCVFVKYLPKPLRNAGMLSDDPKTLGPWLHSDGN